MNDSPVQIPVEKLPAQTVSSSEDQKCVFEIWTPEAETVLKNIVTLGCVYDWSKVAILMKTQLPAHNWADTECSEHWELITNQPDSKKSWTEQEELEMIVLHKHCDNKWESISTLLKGRNNNSVKNKFYSIFRKMKNKVQRLETGFNSRIELLEILYMMALMETHLQNPSPPILQKGRRGKDFLYTLLPGLTLEDIKNFREELAKKNGKEPKLSEVWSELAVPLEGTKFKLPDAISKAIAKDNLISKELSEENLLPQEELIKSLQNPTRGMILPKYNDRSKGNKLGEEEKSNFHSAVFLNKPAQPNPLYWKDALSTGVKTPAQNLLSPMSSALQITNQKQGYSVPIAISPCSYGDFSAVLSQQMHSPLYPTSPVQALVIQDPAIMANQMTTPSMFPVPAGYIVQPVYHTPQIMVMPINKMQNGPNDTARSQY